MKKFWLCLGLTLMLTCCCGVGYYGFGTSPAFGQDYYYEGMSCNPSDPYCYNEYHSAPYADPLSQLLYYVAPPVQRDYRYETPQRYERQEGKDRGRGHQDRGHQEHGQR